MIFGITLPMIDKTTAKPLNRLNKNIRTRCTTIHPNKNQIVRWSKVWHAFARPAWKFQPRVVTSGLWRTFTSPVSRATLSNGHVSWTDGHNRIRLSTEVPGLPTTESQLQNSCVWNIARSRGHNHGESLIFLLDGLCSPHFCLAGE